MRVMSCNLRYDNPGDEEYAWENRLPAMKKIWEQIDADFIGVQEGLPHQIDDLMKSFPEYNYVGKGREEHGQGEQVGIYYKKNVLSLVEQGHFWISDSPEIPGSRSYGTDVPRMVTWVLLGFDNKNIVFLNTHLDHKSQEARRKGAEIICDFLDKYIDASGIILTGDLNAPPDADAVKTLLECGYLKDVFKAKNKSTPTYHGFTEDAKIVVDYILASQHLKIGTCEVVKDKPDGVYPSDHYPIYSDIEIEI
ncbi:MAG: endonuclease/exonuclease/phosphatase family protein [Bacillota bacterium]